MFEGEFSLSHGYEATVEILARSPRPTAIVAGGNILMHGALRALAEAGIQVGADMSFVGCDDVAVAEFHRPAIAVVHRDVAGDGRGGRRDSCSRHWTSGTRAPIEDVTLPTEFLDRPSCAPPASKSRQTRRRDAPGHRRVSGVAEAATVVGGRPAEG